MKDTMKKMMWIVSFLCLIGTAVAIQFLPESVPMHYDAAGKIDRWGSRNEKLIFPVVVLALSLFWHLFIRAFEKKAEKAKAEKDRESALSNAKVLSIVGFANALFQTGLHAVLLYGSFTEAQTQASEMSVDIGKAGCFLMGIFFLILGNFMTKTRINGTVGLRTRWSMYNDNTWRRSNRFGAIALILEGLFAIFGALLIPDSFWAVVATMVLGCIAVIAGVVYSHRVYLKERSKEASA